MSSLIAPTDVCKHFIPFSLLSLASASFFSLTAAETMGMPGVADRLAAELIDPPDDPTPAPPSLAWVTGIALGAIEVVVIGTPFTPPADDFPNRDALSFANDIFSVQDNDLTCHELSVL